MIQAIMNEQTIARLKNCFAYIDTIKDQKRKGHHVNVVLQHICKSEICLEEMSEQELENFDIKIMARLMMCDML
jgi:hypothetical protein